MMKLGASSRGVGYNVSAWRHPSVDPGAGEKISHYIKIAQIAEEALFDMVFFADALSVMGTDDVPGSADRYARDAELDPSTILPALAVATKNIGLVSTQSTTYHEPYNLARRYLSIDHISGGRAGWNAVTSFFDTEGQNFNRDRHWDKAERYERANEFIEVVIGLWSGWEVDALVRDKVLGMFLDSTKVHALNHVGKYFQVRGPLTQSRSPQGRPIIVQAGASHDGLNLAGRFADLVFLIPRTREIALTRRQELHDYARKFGRDPADILALPGIQTVVGRTEQEARDKYQVLVDIVDPLVGLSQVTRQFGKFITAEMFDEIVPDTGGGQGAYSVAAESVRIARENKWTVREFCKRVGLGQHATFMGTPDQVADQMVEWFESGACDGFNILPTHTPEALVDFAEHVVPRLQDRGIYRKAYEGSTLRENLGLKPIN
jgi:FMN-dependent oxidoreductase (nitrilotriacetate monooxygenase family)